MNPTASRQGRECRRDYESVSEYGGNVLRCPQCGSLWLNGGGLKSLIRELQNHRVNPELTCCEFGVQCGVGKPAHL